ncbi:MAG TPA: hypothetical protein PLV68_05305, partial [Ilumatobacteraceae bacterium]|nr:hypothetical protein [Ilumatobacteraceae bacterium]
VRDGEVHHIGFNPVGLARTPLLRGRSRAGLLASMAKVMSVDPARWTGRPWSAYLGALAPDVAAIVSALARTSTYVDAPDTFDAGAALVQLKAGLRGVLYLDGGW